MLTRSQGIAGIRMKKYYVEQEYIEKPVLRIGGPAGTGKTYLIKAFMDMMGFNASNCLVLAYTGQAVNMLRQKGIPAYTIHSQLFNFIEVDRTDDNDRVIRIGGIPYKDLKFVPVESLPINIRAMIVDEASFLPKTIENIMISYGIPIYEIGDPIQLPPVADEQCFTLNNLDYILEEPMRQEADSEIIDLATRLRHGEKINPKKYWKDVIFIKSKNTAKANMERFRPFFKYSNAILTCTNKQRQDITTEFREQVLKTDNPFPIKGEKLICRKNNWRYKLGDYPLTNGTIGKILYGIPRSNIDMRSGLFYIDFQPNYIENDYYDNMVCDAEYFLQPFGEKTISRWNPGNKMEFAHAITTHQSQGSQFDTVSYMDKYHGTQEYMMRIRYTAVTRAVKKLMFFMEPA